MAIPKQLELRWTVVDSSNVGLVRYNKNTQELDVMFKGGDGDTFYRYADVSNDEFIDMLHAESIGGHFIKEIKATKDCEKIDEETI